MTALARPAAPTAPATPERRPARFWRATRTQFANEFRLLARDPAAMIFAAVLPLVAITVMSAIPPAREPLADFGGLSVVQSYAPTITLFATSIIGLTLLPATLGGYRELGVLRRLRTTPASPSSLLLAMFAVMAALGVVVAALIVLIPAGFGAGLPQNLASFALAAMLSLLSFVALGALLAAVIPNAKAAAGVGNAVAAVMWFAAGMWLPRVHFPGWLTTLTDLTPGGAAASAMTAATTGAPFAWQPVLVLIAWTVGAGVLARATFRWE